MKHPIILIALILSTLLPIPAQAATIYDLDFDPVYYGGQHKVGTDIPAGEYVLIIYEGKSSAYFCVSSDPNGKDIIFNDNFACNSVVTIKDGEYIELSRCFAVPIDDFYRVAYIGTSATNAMLVVGRDIGPGEYKLTAVEDQRAYYCVYPDSRHDDIVANKNFDGSTYVTVKEGQYLILKRCIIHR